MDGLRLPDEDRLQVALTFSDTKATRWCTLAIPRSGRPTNCTLFKVKLIQHYAPYSAAEAMYRLRQARQRGTITDYLDRFNEALADCGNIPRSESLQIFVEGLQPGIRRSVHMAQPFTLSDAIRMAVYIQRCRGS